MLKVYIHHKDFGNQVEVYFLEERDGQVISSAKPVEIVFEPIDPATEVEPTFKIGRRYAQDFLRTFAKAIIDHGIKPEPHSKLEGKLEATEYHLKDLRKLLKL